MQIFLSSEAFLPAGTYLSHNQSFPLFSSRILVQHIINPHINGNLLVFLSVEICLTGLIHGLGAGWRFVPSDFFIPSCPGVWQAPRVPPLQTSRAEADKTTPVAHTRDLCNSTFSSAQHRDI